MKQGYAHSRKAAVRPVGSPIAARILVVDDGTELATRIREAVAGSGYDVRGLSDSREITSHLELFHPDVCVFDLPLPQRTGADLLALVKAKSPHTEVIFLISHHETSQAVELMERGAADFLPKPIEVNLLLLSIRRALEHRRLVLENDDYRARLQQLVIDKTKNLNEALNSLNPVHTAQLDALSLALDFRDQSTSGHSRRVADLTAGVATNMGIKDAALVQIEHGALLHDIGKLKIPESILWKPARLTKEEWKTMRKHAEYGYEFLSNLEFLHGAAEIVFSHHEKYDGSGYPRGLKGEEIPLGARVFSIVDTIDAMIYKRPYNTPVTFTLAASEIRRCARSQFDPSLIEPTLAYLGDHIPQELI